MKNLLIFFGILNLTLWGCKKNDIQKTGIVASESAGMVTQDDPPQLRVDSLRVADSAIISKTLTLAYIHEILLFAGLNKTVQDSLYKGELYEGKAAPADYSRATVERIMQARQKKYFDDANRDIVDFMPQSQQTWNQNSGMTLLSNRNGYLTVMYSGHGYTGGAHGYAYENYKVIDLQNQKKLQLSDIIDTNSVNWNSVLLKNLGATRDELFEPKALSFTQNFHFDENKITFSYGQYEIAPYSAGIIDLTIPFSQLSRALKPEFKHRMRLK